MQSGVKEERGIERTWGGRWGGTGDYNYKMRAFRDLELWKYQDLT